MLCISVVWCDVVLYVWCCLGLLGLMWVLCFGFGVVCCVALSLVLWTVVPGLSCRLWVTIGAVFGFWVLGV